MKEKIKLNFKTIKKFENHDVLSYPCVIQIKSCATYCRPNVLDTRIIVLNNSVVFIIMQYHLGQCHTAGEG